MLHRVTFLLFALLLLSPSLSWAAGPVSVLLPPDVRLQGIRSLGLGVPAVALSPSILGGTSAQNPAWTGTESKELQKEALRGLYFPSLLLGANGTTRALAKAYFGGHSSTQKALEDFLKEARNQQTPFGFIEFSPGVTIWRTGLSLFAKTEVEGYVGASSSAVTGSASEGTAQPVLDESSVPRILSLSGDTSEMEVNVKMHRGVRLSFSTPYKNTGVMAGVTVRPTWRSDFSGSVPLSEPLVTQAAQDLRKKFNETRGVPVDVALVVRVPRWAMKPSLGLVVEDMGNTSYRAASSLHQDLVQKANFSAGLSGWLVQEKIFSAQCTFAGHHLNDGRVSKASTVGFGCEAHVLGRTEGDIVVAAPLTLRAGLTKQGVSYGVSWDMPFAALEVASATAEVAGPAGSQSRKDRRYFLRMTVDASQP